MTDTTEFDAATQFVHDCMRARLRADDAPMVHRYCEGVFQEGRRDHVVRAMETLHPHDIESLENRYLKPLGASCEHRGDDAAFIFRRVG